MLQSKVTTLTQRQLGDLFGKSTTNLAIQAFKSVMDYVQQITSGAVIGASANAIPVNPGDLSFTAVSNTQLKLQYMGSDNVIRSVSLTLA